MDQIVDQSVVELRPWLFRPEGPYRASDVPTAEKLAGEHGILKDDPLICRGEHRGVAPSPCLQELWAARVLLANRRGAIPPAPPE